VLVVQVGLAQAELEMMEINSVLAPLHLLVAVVVEDLEMDRGQHRSLVVLVVVGAMELVLVDQEIHHL
jgi:hypothetical protein